MNFTGAEISALIGSYLWPFFRVGALIAAMPVFNSAYVPIRIRLVIAAGITFAVVPVLPPVPQVDVISGDGLLITAHQVMIGLASGFIFNLVLGVFVIAGHTIGMQMGLGFATMVDPSNGEQAPLLSMFFLMLVTLFFVLLDGHLALIGLIAKSFYTLPIGTTGLSRETLYQVVAWGSEMFSGALLVALPAVTALLLVNLALGIMGRAAPQMNIFAVGFSVTIVAGFYVMLITLPLVLAQFQTISVSGFEIARNMLKVH